jgi:O-antigen/teichoic acid export membrane protein
MWLLSRWIVRILAAPEFFDAFEPIGLLAAGAALYALYMVLLVILGRTGRTEFNFPATGAALAVNVGLNLLLVPPFGIVGAAVALVLSYLVVLALMYVFTQRLFPVPYEWPRLTRVLLTTAILIAAGELFLPTSGAAGLLARTLLCLLYPLALLATGFFTPSERRWLSQLRHPSVLIRRAQAFRPAPAAVDGAIPEAAEAELMDEDARL